MNAQEALHMSDVFKAYGEGKTVQIKRKNREIWSDIKMGNECWDTTKYDFRVKPSLQYRQFRNAEEFLHALYISGPYLRSKRSGKILLPINITDENVYMYYDKDDIRLTGYTYTDLLNWWEFQNGTVCGKLISE